MKISIKKKVFTTLCIASLALILVPSTALPWDIATHTYIEEHLFKQQGLTDSAVLYNRIYGSMTIDIFNSNFTSPFLEFATYLHDPTQNNFLKVWEKAGAGAEAEKAFAYGFVGHNNTWGMDSTAHISGVTYGRGEGYVIAKARILAAVLKPMLESPEVGLSLPDDVLVGICHYLVESGVDLLVRSLDPSIGNKLMAAAFYRSDEIPGLLVKAYAPDFSALAGSSQNVAQIILAAEGMFRASTMGYGWALTQDNALDLVAGGLARQAVGYFNFLGLPPVPDATVVQVAKQGIFAAMSLCAPDFEAELRATTGWVNGRLSSEEISWQ
ncbi:MAG: hypothetical protein ACM3MD_03045 [Betaproteobacteria bacterium]